MGKRKIKSYSLEFKQSSAKLAAESDEPISEVARSLAVHETTLRGWVKRFETGDASSKKESEASELKRLRKELIRVKQERDILKKAAAYFASEAQ